MIEIKLQLDEIDYSGIAELVIPIAKEKLAEQNNFFGGIIGKHVPKAALTGAASTLFKLMTLEQKDDVAVSLINKYADNIV